jgi:hypothetical protein
VIAASGVGRDDVPAGLLPGVEEAVRSLWRERVFRLEERRPSSS